MDDYMSTRRKGPSARPVLVAVLASFLLGGAIAGYAVYSTLRRLPAPPPVRPPKMRSSGSNNNRAVSISVLPLQNSAWPG